MRFAVLLLAALPIVGCADDPPYDPPSSDGDCNARIEWDGVAYRPHNELNQAAPRGDRLGTGDVLDCDGTSLETVSLFALDGVDASLAIGIGRGEWRGVYVAEGVPEKSWPEVLKSN